MKALYAVLQALGLSGYSLLMTLAQPLLLFKLKQRAQAEPLYGLHQAERFGFYSQPRGAGFVWVHAVSLGETNAAKILIDHLRTEVHLRSVGQKDPLLEFKHEAFALFDSFSLKIKIEIAHALFKFEMMAPPRQTPIQEAPRQAPRNPRGPISLADLELETAEVVTAEYDL